MKVSLLKRNNSFYAYDEYSAECMNKFNDGQIYFFEVKKARNPKFHNKAFSLLNMLFENQDDFDNFEWFRFWLTMKAGYADTAVAPNGKMMYKAKSLSFENMDEIEFQQWYNDIINFSMKTWGYEKQMFNMLMAFT